MRPETSKNVWTKRIGPSGAAGFTLIELLVVMAVIALLASMIFPVTKAINRNKVKTRTKSELRLLETAIESYKAKLGHYPPDNGTNHLINQLYYELVGATYAKNANNSVNPSTYLLLDGGTLGVAAFTNALAHPNIMGLSNPNPVSGLVNFVPTVDNEEGSTVVNFIKTGFTPAQFLTEPTTGLRFIVSTIQWPVTTVSMPPSAGFVANHCAWRYNSLNPPNNPGSFDLWVDVYIDGKTNRFSNWSRDPIIVNTLDE